jgi:hypothetical protein
VEKLARDLAPAEPRDALAGWDCYDEQGKLRRHDSMKSSNQPYVKPAVEKKDLLSKQANGDSLVCCWINGFELRTGTKYDGCTALLAVSVGRS